MFQRNIRKIYPWKVSQILSLIHMNLENDTWSGNQTAQDAFTKSLEEVGLKREGVQYDLHSGGARTYFSQLESLGLFFTREDGSMWLTIAGQDLVDGTYLPAEIMRTQLLNYQYPSIYSQVANVKIHPRIKVKPFLFVLELLLDPEIEYLTDSELIIPVMYGHNSSCIGICKSKILAFRESQDILSVIDNPAQDLFTPRTRGRSTEKALEDFKNIANTCKNFLESCSLVISQVTEDSRIKQIVVNEGVLPDILSALANKNTFIPVGSAESFQRKYGAWNRQRDTRNLTRGTTRVSRGEPIIHALFAEYAGKNLVLDMPMEFVDKAVGHGFDRQLVINTIEPYLVNSLSLYEQNFMELSSGGRATANDFEKAVRRLFEERLHYKATHTGQRHRAGKTGGFSDIFIQESSGRFCAIIDTKASPKYDLSAADFHTMTNSYIPSIQEIAEYQGEELGFCAYVAGGFTNSMNDRVRTLSAESGECFAAIKAYDLLKLCQKEISTIEQENITDIFRSKKLLGINDFVNIHPN
jgi:hypothetical protein